MFMKMKNWIQRFKYHLSPLCNQRGELGDADELPDDNVFGADDDQGDDGDDATLPPDGDGADGDADDTDADDDHTQDQDGLKDGDGTPDGDDADETPAYKREIDSLKEDIRTLKTNKTATERVEHQDGAQTDTPSDSIFDQARGVKVNYTDTTHPFHGKTLGQIYAVDPQEAFAIDPYRAGLIQHDELNKESAAARAHEEGVEQIRNEQNEFRNEFAKEAFEADFTKLDAKRQGEVDSMLDRVQTWMMDNKKYGITISEAYYLMDRAGQTGKALKKVMDAAQRGGVRTVKSTRDSAMDTSEANMAKWDNKTMSDHLDGLSDSQFTSFMKTAPKAVRRAFPSLPWS
jgi:hypothetical protein